MKDEKMLQYIHKTAELGKEGTRAAMNSYENRKLSEALNRQYRSYDEIYTTSGNYLNARGILPQSAGPFTKMSVSMTQAMATLGDRSPSKIAELMIRGTTTGLTKSIQHIKDYTGNDSMVLALAHQLREAEETGIEEMKSFL